MEEATKSRENDHKHLSEPIRAHSFHSSHRKTHLDLFHLSTEMFHVRDSSRNPFVRTMFISLSLAVEIKEMSSLIRGL